MKRNKFVFFLFFSVSLALLLSYGIAVAQDPGIPDTVKVGTVKAPPNSQVVVDVYAFNDEVLGSFTIILTFPDTLSTLDVKCDSISFVGTRTVGAALKSDMSFCPECIDNAKNRLEVFAVWFATGLLAGSGPVAKLYFSAGLSWNPTGPVPIDTTQWPVSGGSTVGMTFVDFNGMVAWVPVFHKGYLNRPALYLTPGPSPEGKAKTDIFAKFYVTNWGPISDTCDLYITDSLGWTIDPIHHQVYLNPDQVDTVSFKVSIPLVRVGTVDKLRVRGISRSDSTNADTVYSTVRCNGYLEGVYVNPGANKGSYADSTVSVAFSVQNTGLSADSFSLDISDVRGWNITPNHSNIYLNTFQAESVYFTVSVPYVPLGTTDNLTLLAVSKSNPFARDSASLTVTCNAFREGVNVTTGGGKAGPTRSASEVIFYVRNTGFTTDTYNLDINDPSGWVTSPLHYQKTLNPGERDTLKIQAFIPNVSVGTQAHITLNAVSQTNPYATGSASLYITCNYYNLDVIAIQDIPKDQGKQVRLKWSSFTDSDPSVTSFTIFRRIDPLMKTASVPINISNSLSSFPKLLYPPGEWEGILTIGAFGETLYTTVVPTLKDSTITDGMYYSVFFIRAGTNNAYVYYDSPIDSGYSLDNLSPSTPTGFLATHSPAATKLTWRNINDYDFKYFTLYRDSTSGFQPSTSNRLSYTIDTSFTDSTAQLGRTYFYIVSATDFSGNESSPSNETTSIRYITGDANTDGKITVADVVYLVNYLFKFGPPPRPIESGMANCDSKVTVADVVYLVNYLFKGGPPPCEP